MYHANADKSAAKAGDPSFKGVQPWTLIPLESSLWTRPILAIGPAGRTTLLFPMSPGAYLPFGIAIAQGPAAARPYSQYRPGQPRVCNTTPAPPNVTLPAPSRWLSLGSYSPRQIRHPGIAPVWGMSQPGPARALAVYNVWQCSSAILVSSSGPNIF